MEGNMSSVTCSERVRMNAIFAVLFILAGDGIILLSLNSDKADSIGNYLTGLIGFIAIIVGIYHMLNFLNKKITVSSSGVIYTNWANINKNFDWSQVKASHRSGRNAQFVFMLSGKKVVFYGYSLNAQALYDYLLKNNHFDLDTVYAAEKAKDADEERVKLMQKKARTDASDWDDDE